MTTMQTLVDILWDTEDLSNEELGAYVRLLMQMWKKGRALVIDEKRIPRLLHCTKGRAFKKLLPGLDDHFDFPTDEAGLPVSGILRHKRLKYSGKNGPKIEKISAAFEPNQGVETDPESPPESPPDSRGGRAPALSKPSSIEKEREREQAGGRARAALLPEGFTVPPEWLDEAAAKRLDAGLPEIPLKREAVAFVAHFAGTPVRKANWHGAFLTWCLNAKAAAALALAAETTKTPEDAKRAKEGGKWRVALVKFYRSNGEDWPPELGPQPGKDGCQAPDWLITEVVRGHGKSFAPRRKATG